MQYMTTLAIKVASLDPSRGLDQATFRQHPLQN